MATALAIAAAYVARQKRLSDLAAEHAAAAWSQVDRNAIRDSWAALVPGLVQTMTAGQTVAASDAQTYVTATVLAYGATPDPAGAVDPGAFAGTAADGRPLESLLTLPAITALQEIAAGVLLEQAMDSALAQLLRIASSEVTDAGRVATGVAVAAERRVIGYVRYLNPPSCSRCAVLAGRLYRWSAGFQRHPHCDCAHRPVTREEWDRHETSVTDSPERYFRSLGRVEQDRLFTQAGAQAIRDGADIGRVVNSSRGMYTAGGRKLTAEATTRRGGVAGPRPAPEQIYADALGDRDQAIALLRRFGYIL